MAENKTQPTTASVTAFINAIEDPEQKKDARKVAGMMRKATGKRPKMWGTSMVGFDRYDYQYESGRSGRFMITGFSPRAQNIAVYIMPGFSKYGAHLKKLGKHKTGKSCLYIKRLADVDRKVLEQLVRDSVAHMRKTYGKT